jgi:hypothetical protein
MIEPAAVERIAVLGAGTIGGMSIPMELSSEVPIEFSSLR